MRAFESGEALLFEMTDERLRELATSDEHLAGLRGLELNSMIFAPMSVGGPALGVLVFVNHRGSRRFDETDLAIAVETARRVGDRDRELPPGGRACPCRRGASA